MDFNLSDLQVVVVSSFFDQIDDPRVSELFVNLLKLKKSGYQSKHSNRFLPVGTHDFFGHHLILCHKKSFEPILCAKIISYKTCQYYNTDFPLSDLGNFLLVDQKRELEKIIHERLLRDKDITYSGGLTINPVFKGFGSSPLFKDIYTGLHYLAHLTFDYSTMMGFALPKVGTDIFFRTWGVKPLEVNGVPMQPTPTPFVNGIDSILVWGDVENLSEYKKDMGKRYGALWEDRIDFSVRRVLPKAA
ncbi:MAG: hypothetical protein LW878_08345 [Proteobacteria bacterium]|nr:hypothetical protein [Pseudomonadota bacterium]